MTKKIDLEGMSRDELVKLNKRVVNKIRSLEAEMAIGFSKGDKVKFKSKKTGKMVYGTVAKPNRKTIDINDNTTSVTWRVSASMVQSA